MVKDKKFPYTRFVVAILLPPLLPGMFLSGLLFYLIETASNQGEIIGDPQSVFMVTLTFCYPLMLFFGIPTILLLERLRLKKYISYLLYILAGVLAPLLLVVVKGPTDGPIILAMVMSGLVSAFLAALIMLMMRHDWH